MNIFRKKLIEGLKIKINIEIEMMNEDDSYETPSEAEKDIIEHAEALGYDYNDDAEKLNFDLKATPLEIWEYWIEKIIPKIEKEDK
jgi:hypothetical protein